MNRDLILLGHVRIAQEPLLDASQSLDDPDLGERKAKGRPIELVREQRDRGSWTPHAHCVGITCEHSEPQKEQIL